jgi:hypothetical protein
MSLLYIKFDNTLSNLAFPAPGAAATNDASTGIRLKAHDPNNAQNYPPVMVGSHFFDITGANQNAFTQQKTLTQFSIRPGRLLLSHYTVSFPSNRVINHLADEMDQITVAHNLSNQNDVVGVIDQNALGGDGAGDGSGGGGGIDQNALDGIVKTVVCLEPTQTQLYNYLENMDRNYGDLKVFLPWIEDDIASTDHFGGLVLPVDKSKTFYSASPMIELKTDSERIPKVFEMTVMHTNDKPFLGELNLYFSYVD